MPEEPEEVVILLVVGQWQQQLVEVVQHVVDVQQEGQLDDGEGAARRCSPAEGHFEGVRGGHEVQDEAQARSPPGSAGRQRQAGSWCSMS